MNATGDMFYSENQGPWNGACALEHLVFRRTSSAIRRQQMVFTWLRTWAKHRRSESGSRIYVEAKKIPELVSPGILFALRQDGAIGQRHRLRHRASGKFGPFEHQIFVGDQHHSNIGAICSGKRQRTYQGVCFPFREGFASGIVPMIQAPDGSFFVGGTNRGWGSAGPRPSRLERLVWTGKVPFEMYNVQLTTMASTSPSPSPSTKHPPATSRAIR